MECRVGEEEKIVSRVEKGEEKKKECGVTRVIREDKIKEK